MELMKSRSVPENLRQLADIIWPEAPVTGFCTDQARAHLGDQQNELHRNISAADTVSQTNQLVSSNIRTQQSNGRSANHLTESTSTGHSSKDYPRGPDTCYNEGAKITDDTRVIVEQACSQGSHVPKQYPTFDILPTYSLSSLQEARAGKRPVAPDGETYTNSSQQTENVEVLYANKVETSNANLSQPAPRDDKPAHSAEGKESRSKAIQRRLLGRFAIRQPSWPDPQLSLGTRCNRLAGNECWEAVGPAKELFSSIAQPIADLLNTRVDELDEDEPVADNVLTFSMYMVGKDSSVATPTLLFICASSKPRKRAIKFLKESMILNVHPKIKLADSPACPLAAGSSHLRLLASKASCPRVQRRATAASCSYVLRRETQPPSEPSNRGLSKVAIGGIIGGAVAFLLIVLIVSFLILRGLKKVVKLKANLDLSRPRRKSGSRLHSKPSLQHLGSRHADQPDIESMSVDSLMVANSIAHRPTQLPSALAAPFELEGSAIYPAREASFPLPFDSRGHDYLDIPPSITNGLNVVNSSPTEQPGSDYSSSYRSSAWSSERLGRDRSDSSDQSDPSLGSCRGATELDADSEEHIRSRYVSPLILDSNQSARRPEVAGIPLKAINEAEEYGLSNSELRQLTLIDAGSSHQATRNGDHILQSISRQSEILNKRDPGAVGMLDMQNRGRPSLLNVEETTGRPIVVLHNGQQGNRALDAGPSASFHDDCGLPVFCLSTGRRATIGGIVSSNGIVYGMTVAHVFEVFTRNSMVQDEGRQGEMLNEDLEFTFDEDDEDDEVNEDVIMSDVAITSHASMSSMASPSLSLSRSVSTKSYLSQTGSSKGHSSFGATIPTIQEGEAATPMGSPLDEFGQLAATSMLHEDLGLDWALVELSTTSIDGLKDRSTYVDRNAPKPYPTTRGVVQQLLKDSVILVLRGRSGVSRGTISSSTTMMKFSGRSHFQEVWVARLDTPSVEGDSGAWVVDAENGDLYGHIVAGIPGEKFAYVVPAMRFFPDMEDTLGSPINFISLNEGKATKKVGKDVPEDDPEVALLLATSMIGINITSN